ncbi:MAG: Holliday junction resolvase RuvX [Armatimonadetes bacterium]|nr:Holliday junction resolvase RuvX [Armatimonadota bacterium]NIM23936.1 Holliday junction resolvase RuvX [Armatimonadota bacterium]NIM67783.1 Holliday junction resolvase RuvX [Armatimonadota bacterium]NIM76323.1 Holliday junction resolvase RuvX [Armatimonadota bacterium]NIN06017.1 Holliday junction resolvase RuvX [Armatimonadota bacterium]
MRILGIDLGKKRIGLALSDALGILASPFEVFEYDSSAYALNRITAAAKDNGVEKMVIGLPLNMNGTRGPEAEGVQAFAEVLEETSGIPVVCWDERLTTTQAQKALLEGDVSRENRRVRADMVAAALLLQAYLDTYRNREGSS